MYKRTTIYLKTSFINQAGRSITPFYQNRNYLWKLINHARQVNGTMAFVTLCAAGKTWKCFSLFLSLFSLFLRRCYMQFFFCCLTTWDLHKIHGHTQNQPKEGHTLLHTLTHTQRQCRVLSFECITTSLDGTKFQHKRTRNAVAYMNYLERAQRNETRGGTQGEVYKWRGRI